MTCLQEHCCSEANSLVPASENMDQLYMQCDHLTLLIQRGTCIKGLFWPPSRAKKLKIALHLFLLIGLLEE